MIDAIMGLLDTIVMDWLPGQEILNYVDQYFIQQTEVNQVLMVIGMGILAVFGLFGLVKAILKMTGNIIKLILLLALAYYIVFVVLDINLFAVILG